MTNKKIPFTAALERSGLLINSVYRETESYFLAYNLLEDFVYAKLIMEKHTAKEDLKNYLKFELLKIENGKITNYSDVDVFIVVCSLYAEKYKEECIDIIDSLNEEFDKQHIIDSYLDSFLWRKSSTIDSDYFIKFLNCHQVRLPNVCQIFIENSIKPNHPLNAELLHTVLLKKKLSHRDYLWTIHINDLTHEDERIFQLIDFFEKGNKLDTLTHNNIMLLLILFSWLLTSSNRFLRDKSSKAMIELLKNNFEMCKPLLEKFETVNDPYVIQRLYGIVFGACMKRSKEYRTEFKELTKYIYNTVFNRDTVYPDILLRDYARLILERWLYESPHDSTIIEVAKIRPPYRSEQIATVKKEDYYQEKAEFSGFNSIVLSMLPDHVEGPSMYGDFGRYVFQAAITHFDGIDMENLYHYAIQFIRDKLGYHNKLFGYYDTNLRYYDRSQTKKVERIGKKYQWIAMYNILARISDTNLLKGWNNEPYPFEGAWEPYVRDFNPTLNCNFLLPSNLPHFKFTEDNQNEFISTSYIGESMIRKWAKTTCAFFGSHSSKLMFKDSSGQTWILLNQYEQAQNKQDLMERYSTDFADGAQEIWSMSHGYVVKENEFEFFKDDLENRDFTGRWFPESYDAYQLFNREHAWSPGYKSMFDEYWLDYEAETGEKIITKNTGLIPKFDESKAVLSFEEQEWENVEPVKRKLGKVMPTYSRTLWEAQYDASQEESPAFDVPCKDIIDYLQLEQNEYDGYFYSKDGTLVSFDGDLAKICDGLLIRKDYLDKYLSENGLRLFWACLGEKQYFCGDRNQIWGEWSGFFYMKDDTIFGAMENKKVGP